MTSKDIFDYGTQRVINSVNELAVDVKQSKYISEDDNKLEILGMALIQLAQKIEELSII